MGTEAKRFKAWITKYALTKGIFEAEVETTSIETMVLVPGGSGRCPTYCHGKDWHRDEASAKARANEMLRVRIRSLEKQLYNLRGKSF